MAAITIAALRGATPKHVSALKAKSITNADHLLASAGTPGARADLAKSSGLGDNTILELVNRADLARIKGIGRQYSNLLEDAGVDTVPELAQRNATNLHQALGSAATKSGVKRPPSMREVEDWIKQAKSLPRMVHY